MGTNTTSFYLDPPQLIGRPNNDGTVTLTPLELKKLNDYNYAVAKLLQGNLNLANLNTDTNQVFTDMDGNITAISATAAGLTVDVGNLEGDLTSLSVTVDGLRIADETGSYTIIDGDKLKSKDHATAAVVQIENGMVKIANGNSVIGYMTYYNNNLYIFGDELLLNADGNAVIEGTNIRLGTNAETSNIYLKGDIYLNGNQSLADYILEVVGS